MGFAARKDATGTRFEVQGRDGRPHMTGEVTPLT